MKAFIFFLTLTLSSIAHAEARIDSLIDSYNKDPNIRVEILKPQQTRPSLDLKISINDSYFFTKKKSFKIANAFVKDYCNLLQINPESLQLTLIKKNRHDYSINQTHQSQMNPNFWYQTHDNHSMFEYTFKIAPK